MLAKRLATEIGKRLVLVCLSVVGTACASLEGLETMVPQTQQALVCEEGSRFSRAIVVSDVRGGKKLHPMMGPSVGSGEFKEALQGALDAHGYLSPDPLKASYLLKVFIIEIGRPIGGVTAKVDSYVRFTLVRGSDAKILFDDVVHGEFAATIEHSFWGLQRWELAQLGAMRSSISSLLERLRSIS